MKPIRIVIGIAERCPDGYGISHVVRDYDTVRQYVVCYRNPLHYIASIAYHIGQWFVWMPHRLARRQWEWKKDLIEINNRTETIDRRLIKLENKFDNLVALIKNAGKDSNTNETN